MVPLKVAAVNNSFAKIPRSYEATSSFAHILAQKKNTLKEVAVHPLLSPVTPMNKVFKHMISNHEAATKAMNSSMVRTDYTPEKLLKKQFTMGMFLLREQMYAKTVELSANTLKNFTQMQV